jgi:hypothetical protein
MIAIKKVKLLIFSLFCLSITFNLGLEAKTSKFDLPVLITSAGQSIEAQMVSFNFVQNKIPNKCIQMAENKDLDGIKTLIVVPGHSLKGLGSAGIDANMELNRVKKLVLDAKNKGIDIICIHIGGAARRGPTSQPFIEAALKYAKYCVVYADGNKDNYFNKRCQTAKIPLTVIAKVADLSGVIKDMFAVK